MYEMRPHATERVPDVALYAVNGSHAMFKKYSTYEMPTATPTPCNGASVAQHAVHPVPRHAVPGVREFVGVQAGIDIRPCKLGDAITRACMRALTALLQHLPGSLQQQAVLRVHRERLCRRNTKQLGVKQLGALNERAKPLSEHAWRQPAIIDVPPAQHTAHRSEGRVAPHGFRCKRTHVSTYLAGPKCAL